MRCAYPVIISPAKEGGYNVYIPDWEINTQGGDLTEAIYMARDAIGGMGCYRQDEKQELPSASSMSAIQEIAHTPCDTVSLVDVDFDAYRRRYDNRTVRKNLTIPSWLNEAAEQSGINFSHALQQVLKDQLGIQDYM